MGSDPFKPGYWSFDFGFWILDLTVWILEFWFLILGFLDLDFGVLFLGSGSWIHGWPFCWLLLNVFDGSLKNQVFFLSDFLGRTSWGCAWGSPTWGDWFFRRSILVDFAWKLRLGGPDCLEKVFLEERLPRRFFRGPFWTRPTPHQIHSKVLKHLIQGFRSEFSG